HRNEQDVRRNPAVNRRCRSQARDVRPLSQQSFLFYSSAMRTVSRKSRRFTESVTRGTTRRGAHGRIHLGQGFRDLQLLAFLDDADTGSTPARIRAFELTLVVLSVTELWVHALTAAQQIGGSLSWPLPVLVTLCGAAACVPAWRRLGFLLLA